MGSPVREEQQIKPSDLYQRMKSVKQGRDNENNVQNNSKQQQTFNPESAESRNSAILSALKQTPTTNRKSLPAPNMTKKEKVKTILNDEASKAAFVKKMSKTFGYG